MNIPTRWPASTEDLEKPRRALTAEQVADLFGAPIASVLVLERRPAFPSPDSRLTNGRTTIHAMDSAGPPRPAAMSSPDGAEFVAWSRKREV